MTKFETLLLDKDLTSAWVSFLTAKDLLCPLSQGCRMLLAAVRKRILTSNRARLANYEGFAVNQLLEALRRQAGRFPFDDIPEEITRAVIQCNSLKLIYQPSLYAYVLKINAAMYQLLSVSAGEPGTLLGKTLQETVQSMAGLTDYHHKVLWEDCRFWPTSRVAGTFTILFDRPDGAVLVADDSDAVYLTAVTDEDTLGLNMTIKTASNFPTNRQSFYGRNRVVLHGSPRHTSMRGTLLNVQDRIVSDGLATFATVSEQKLQRAYRRYLAAVETNSLITSLPRVPVRERSTLTKHARKDMRLSLDLDMCCIRAQRPPPYHCKWHFVAVEAGIGVGMGRGSRAAGGGANIGTGVDGEDAHWQQVISLPQGYTLLDTLGKHGLAVKPIFSWRSCHLEPTVSELVVALRRCCEKFGQRPAEMVLYHWANLCRPLEELLERTGVLVSYSFYPSTEQIWFHKKIDRYTHFNDPRCNVCGVGEAHVQAAHLVCPRCCFVHYCSPDHMKQDAHVHKTICTTLKRRPLKKS